MISRLKAVSGIIDYVEFLRYMNHEIATTMEQMEKGMHSEPRAAKVDSRDLKISKVLNVKNKDVKVMLLITELKQYQLKMRYF
jgi:hypothetical protein